jgi:hypothetical protein
VILDSLAILERGYLFASPAAANGVKADCPYCIARHIEKYQPGDKAVMLQGYEAGRLLSYSSTHDSDVVDQFAWADEPDSKLRLMREHWLTLPLEVLTVPFWLPKLSLRNCFILDELAVWFCNESGAGERFHWNNELTIEVARTCWRRRLPVSPMEISRLFLVHGMPEIYQAKFEELFDFAIKLLVRTEGRKALKKLRDELPADQYLYEIWSEQ